MRGAGQPRRWRGLALFWGLALVVAGVGGAALQLLGPPVAPVVAKVEPTPAPQEHAAPEPAVPAVAEVVARPETAPDRRPGSASAGPIAAPDPALLDPEGLPRVGPDGRTPGQAYSSGFAAEPTRPRIGLIIAGIGMSEADSTQAIRLPAGITLAVSPYVTPNPALLDQARRAGHELLLAIPLEPVAYPLNDPGEHALMTGASLEQNARNLDWTLGRFAGYAGTTSALGGPLNGERFPVIAEQMHPVLASLAARGLFYVDARIGSPVLPSVWNRSIDLIADDPGDAAALEAKLAVLESTARDKGSALGLVGLPTPVAIERLAAWTNGLAARGFVLAPASALMLPPNEVPE
jgi:polysaccharide deacetylase 2 family uncharacterized protein YibQ